MVYSLCEWMIRTGLMTNFECTLTLVDPAVVVSIAEAMGVTLTRLEVIGDGLVVQAVGDDESIDEFEEEVFQYECVCIHNQ